MTKVACELQKIAAHTRVFVSMPYISGITPVCMERENIRIHTDKNTGLERRDGYFTISEAGLSPLDHGNLYGDGVFEGIRIDDRRILLFREHIDRWFDSARKVGIDFPYTREQIASIIIELSRKTLGDTGTSAYLRPVLTRGLGNLGVNPAKCVAPTLYIICSSIALYPKERYEHGIEVAIARNIRRNDPSHLNPNIKTNNYLNNVLALLETQKTGTLETIMLTNDGYVAEATADNIFVLENDNGHPRLSCPAAKYALVGLTRNLVLDTARQIGMEVIENDKLLPTDLIGSEREVFITGTACGLMPICAIDGLQTASHGHRPLLDKLRKAIDIRRNHDDISFCIDKDERALESYMAQKSNLYES